jgi:uncharacterized hydrophobic protein (TIGR00271 family)
VLHLRIVAPHEQAKAVHALLCAAPSAIDVIHVPGVSQRPAGDLVMCDVAREDASVIVADLKELQIDKVGSISMSPVDTISELAVAAERHAPGAPADAVVWEELEQRTSESVEISGVFLLYMALAAIIACVGIILDSEVLIVGAMVVGPEFGPIAGFCVAAVQRKTALARRSGLALAIGFPLAIVSALAATAAFDGLGVTPDDFSTQDHALANVISSPDAFAFIVAAAAGTAGMLSLSTAKSGALIGVLISVTTIPAASNIGIAAYYGDWDTFWGSAGQLAVNLAAILVAGTITLAIQRMLYERRRARHLGELGG